MNKYEDQAFWLYENGYIDVDQIEEVAEKLEQKEMIVPNGEKSDDSKQRD